MYTDTIHRKFFYLHETKHSRRLFSHLILGYLLQFNQYLVKIGTSRESYAYGTALKFKAKNMIIFQTLFS